MAKKIILLLAEGFEEVEAVTPIDFLRRADIEVIVAGINGTRVKGAHGIELKADCTLDDNTGAPDGVVIPGGMPGAANIAANRNALALIKKCKQENKLVAAICAAPAIVLDASGIVVGHKITAYPSYMDKLVKNTYVNERVVVDKNVITSQGPGTAAEFAIKIIEFLEGKAAADKVFTGTVQKM